MQVQIRIGIKTMPSHMRILPQHLHMLENRGKILNFIHSYASLLRFSFLIKYRSASAGSGSASPGCQSRSESGKTMRIFAVPLSTHLDNFVYVCSELRYQLSHPAVILHKPSKFKKKTIQPGWMKYNVCRHGSFFFREEVNGYVVTIRLYCTRCKPGSPIGPSYLSVYRCAYGAI